MKRLYYARHGESFINIQDIVATKLGAKNDLGLTELGGQQALAEGRKAAVNGLQADIIISSPLLRALETARIIARELGYPAQDIRTSDLLLELQFGELEGTSWRTFWEAGGGYKNLGAFKGAETMEALQQRAEKALAFLNSLPEDNILVVSHSAFGRALRRTIQGKPWTDEFENSVSLPHGEIIRLV